ncbi:MAG: DUF6282 family protein [Pseudomonadota bacterium]
MRPGMSLLQDAIDCHVHACPHLNGRSVTLLEAVRDAANAGMRAIGLMDNFQNSSGFAALAQVELADLDIEIFGGLIMQPVAGGVSLEAARTAIGYGYGPGTGARFVSLPTHHTRYVAEREGRSPAFLETTFAVPEAGPLPDPVPAIMELCAEHDVVFDCGHVSAAEAVRLAEAARDRGLVRVRTHCSRYPPDAIDAIVNAEAYAEFSFFLFTHATQVGLTHVDQEKHRVGMDSIDDLLPRLAAAGDRAILSSDAGVFLLPPPVEAMREFLVLLEAAGVPQSALEPMVKTNPATLFRVGG